MYSSEKRPFQFNDLKFESWSSMNLSQFSKVVGRIIFKLIWTKLISQIWVFWLACNEISFVISQSILRNSFWRNQFRDDFALSSTYRPRGLILLISKCEYSELFYLKKCEGSFRKILFLAEKLTALQKLRLVGLKRRVNFAQDLTPFKELSKSVFAQFFAKKGHY